MTTALKAKFADQYMQQKLLDTAPARLEERTSNDSTWGTGSDGPNGKGKNLLGKCLMEVRDHYSGAGNSLKAGSWTAAKVEVAGPRYAEQYCLGVRTRKASGACVTRIIYATPATT